MFILQVLVLHPCPYGQPSEPRDSGSLLHVDPTLWRRNNALHIPKSWRKSRTVVWGALMEWIFAATERFRRFRCFLSSQQRTCENKIFRDLKWRYAAYISNIEGLCKGIPTPEVAVKGQHLFFRYLETLVTCILRRCGGEMGGGLFFWMKNMMMVMLLNTRDLQLG